MYICMYEEMYICIYVYMDICIYVRKAGLGSSLTGQCRCPFFYVLVKTSTLFFGSNKIKQGESFNAWGAQVLCEQAPYRNLIGSFKEAHRNLIGTVMGPFQKLYSNLVRSS